MKKKQKKMKTTIIIIKGKKEMIIMLQKSADGTSKNLGGDSQFLSFLTIPNL